MAVFGNTYRSFGELSYGHTDTPLGALGVYNFPPTYSLSFNAKPVIAENDISAKYIRNELTINWIVPYEYIALVRPNPNNDPQYGNGPPSVDTAVQQIKAILMRPRGELRCTFQGLGGTGNLINVVGNGIYGFVINRANDLNHGPVPIDFKYKNLAPQRCVELTWVVACHTPSKITFNTLNQVGSETNVDPITEMSWSRSFDIDEFGIPTITTIGTVEVSSSSYLDIEAQRIRFAFPVPHYCQRVSQKIQFESNATRLSFTLVDKGHNFENALPNRALRMDLSHDMSSNLFGNAWQGKGFLTWNNVISGSITLPSGEAPVTAYFLFWFYVRQRMNRVATGGVASDGTANPKSEKNNSNVAEKVRNIITKISYKESLFTRTHNFRVEYVGTYDVNKLLQQSGLFTPLYNHKQTQSNEFITWDAPDTNAREPWQTAFSKSGTKESNWLAKQWATYKQQFNGSPAWNALGGSWSIYGYLNHRNNTSQAMVWIPEDPITYANKPLVNEVVSNEIKAWINADSETYYTGIGPNLTSTQPYEDPARTYIDYQVDFSIIEDHNTYQFIRQKCDDKIEQVLKSNGTSPTKSTQAFNINNAVPVGSLPSSSDYTSSYNGQSNTTLVMSGYAVRAGLPAPIPSAISYGGNSLIRAGRAIYNNRQINRGEVPIYLATWSIPYYVNTMNHVNVFESLVTNAFSGVLT